MAPTAPPLVGVVLAGGQSRRMGADKGALPAGGPAGLAKASEAERCAGLLASFCSRVVVSVREAQVALEPYRRLPLVVDPEGVAGPAAGLLAAWGRFPEAALLVLAVDMLRVDADLLAELVRQRDPARVATAFRHGSGLFEPLCAIWEPGAAVALRERGTGGSGVSLSRLLGDLDAAALAPVDPNRLASANTAPERLGMGGKG